MKFSLVSNIFDKGKRLWHYFNAGVWTDTRHNWRVNFVKTLNLSMRSFLSADVQSKACALTYRTLLALVPALAILFAIGRGFGLQGELEGELMKEFASQGIMLEKAFVFVDSYLNQSSEGIFVGVGIVLLLWTLISLLSSVEKVFNTVWGVKHDRSFWRKCTDYLAIFLVLPVLIICASGITVFMTSMAERVLPEHLVSPLVSVALDVASFVLIWLFFAGVYVMVPNTRVKFKNALVAGIMSGTAFLILQWLFISGTVYVSKYNAIYGSFAFIPLFLIWLQLVWVITLAGAVICYSSQNIFKYNFGEEVNRISSDYQSQVAAVIMKIIVDDFEHHRVPPSAQEITTRYGLPPTLVSRLTNRMIDAGLLLRVVREGRDDVFGLVSAIDTSTLTLGELFTKLDSYGASSFIPDFDNKFSPVIKAVDGLIDLDKNDYSKILIKDLKINVT